MSSSNSNRRAKMEKEREKQVQDRLQVLICEMLKDEDNKYCVDCDSKGASKIYRTHSPIENAQKTHYYPHRSPMVLVEPGSFSVYPVRRNTPQPGGSHLKGQVRQSRLLDAAAGRGKWH